MSSTVRTSSGGAGIFLDYYELPFTPVNGHIHKTVMEYPTARSTYFVQSTVFGYYPKLDSNLKPLNEVKVDFVKWLLFRMRKISV